VSTREQCQGSAEQGYELAAPHSITSSTAASSAVARYAHLEAARSMGNPA